MKNVLHVVGNMNRGGAESRIMDIFRKISTENYKFYFLVFDEPGCSYYDEIISLGGEFVACPSVNRVGLKRYLKALSAVFSERTYDAVHVHTGTSGGFVLAVAKKAKVPVRIFHARNTFSQKRGGLKRKVYNTCMLSLIRKYSNVRLAVSETAGVSYFGKGCCELGGSVAIIPNAIDEKAYMHSSDTTRQRLREALGVGARKVVGHVGSFRVEKNHSFLLQLFSAFVKKRPETVLILVGDGGMRTQIQEQIRELSLEDKVIMTGVRTDMTDIYCAFDLFLFPSLSEGLPGSVLEAQASGNMCMLSDTIDPIVDMGAGLVEFISLDEPLDVWIGAMERKLFGKEEKPREEQIMKAFTDSGFSLDKELICLKAIYDGCGIPEAQHGIVEKIS